MLMKILQNIFEFRFILELFVLSILFTLHYRKREHFAWRISFLAVICLAVVVIFIYNRTGNWMTSIPITILRYIGLFVAVVIGITFCFEISTLASIFCVTGVYAIQHLFYGVHEIVMNGFKLGEYVSPGNYYLLYVLLYVLIEGTLYALFYRFFIRKFKYHDKKYFDNKFIITLGIFVNLYATVFSIIIRISQENAQRDIFIICTLLDGMCCLFTLYLLFYIFRINVLQDDLNIIESLLQKEKDQFKTSQANIRLINIKCHDLKHQLNHLTNRIGASEVEELKNAISIYDMPITGNQVLDVVIAEKRLQCERENIQFTCMVDGEKLNFMREADVFSLFGNALDNAINSVKTILDKDKRIISMIVKETIGLISIHIENYYQGDLVFEDGMPVTTNKDKDYHGFGMKSMGYIVEKYSGEISIKASEDIFNLNIVFQARAD